MYKVLIDYLNHNGRMRIPGELIDMQASDAAPLIKIGAIEAVPEKSPPGSSDEDNKDKDPETGNTDDADPGQNDPTNNEDGSDASKTGKKESKPKAK